MNDRNLCTPEKPMPQGAKGRWIHTSAEIVDEDYGWYGDGDYNVYECKDCGERWRSEIAG